MAALPNGWLFRCVSWAGNQCDFEGTTNGTDFAIEPFCYNDSDDDSIIAGRLCVAACGTSASMGWSTTYPPTTSVGRLNEDGSSTTDVSGCTDVIYQISCGCF